MPSAIGRRTPPWFRFVGLLLVLWGLAGIFAFYSHAMMSDAALAALPDYDRRMYLVRPGWFDWIYAAATWGGLIGALLLLARRRQAAAAFAVSLLAVAVQFAWVFAATDLIAVKGAGATLPFPLVIFAIALAQLALARHGIVRGWLR
ncbi:MULTISPECIES: hypothetical protein [unclassified Sphingomonas]|uniref:hypothetical protein n=1 Tax=unclassified Sphingomonas TaxID=196159 RepID=UPI0006F733AD|nr:MULTISPECIES: hypothetical protein [unclassified Sphingomonas]KQM98804.1 hypothetical protein ASE78_06145 [Sphingomonas sp. Leaf25]KQN40528.1 hypothetical protein ASE97_01705 [Sphingomonas sp. Leaf42]KQT29882.1 hypothetical protein ASG37_01680 [Sphingomonas sp. Leaf407]